MKHKYTKHYDEKQYCTKTTRQGNPRGKPKLLKPDDDLDLTPRSAEQAREDGLDVPPPEPKTVGSLAEFDPGCWQSMYNLPGGVSRPVLMFNTYYKMEMFIEKASMCT